MIASKHKFDVVISMPWTGIIFSELFNTPLITFSPAGPIKIFMGGSGNDINHNIQPLVTGTFLCSSLYCLFLLLAARFIEPMTFVERLMNNGMAMFTDIFVKYINNLIHNERLIQWGHELPTNEEILRDRFTVFLSNSHHVTHGSWQYGPNVIEVCEIMYQDHLH